MTNETALFFAGSSGMGGSANSTPVTF